MYRRTALRTLAALSAGTLGWPATSYTQSERTTIRVGQTAVESFASALIAKEEGFFDKAGLDAQLQIFNGGGAVVAALLGGALDIGITNAASMSNAHVHGIPLYCFAPGGFMSAATPTTALLVAKASPFKVAKDLNGKTVALSTLHDLVQVSAMKWVDQNGGDSSTVKFIEMPTPEMVPAITAGRVDAAMVVEPFITENKEVTRIFAVPYATLAKTIMISGWVATKDWLDKNRETARKFAAVMRQVAVWATANPGPLATVLAKYTKIPPEVIAQEKHTVWEPNLDAKAIQPVIDASAQYKMLPQRFDAKELFYPL